MVDTRRTSVKQQPRISDAFSRRVKGGVSNRVAKSKTDALVKPKVDDIGVKQLPTAQLQAEQKSKGEVQTKTTRTLDERQLDTNSPALRAKAAEILDARLIEPGKGTVDAIGVNQILVHSQHLNAAQTILRDFDLSYLYGPCVGLTRMERYSRAKDLGLNPPEEVYDILTTTQGRSSLANNLFVGSV
jgi:hypothetical protein